MNYAGFGKATENIRKYRDIKLVTTEKRRNYLVSELNIHTTTFFKESLLAIKMKKNSNINEEACLFLIAVIRSK